MQHVAVWIGSQELELINEGKVLRRFPISSSSRGIGFKEGSLKTPIGRFVISDKIGKNELSGMIFKGRKPTGVLIKPNMEGDVVSTRILWLDGLGKRNANTKARYIYIHGTNQEELIGQPASEGCIRMKNEDVIELFELVETGTEVRIQRGSRS